jgi:serine carboxypeptidase-like clade 1
MMALKKPLSSMDARLCHVPLNLAVACMALLLLPPPPPLSGGRAVTVVTHLPGFDGALPFYMETGYVGVEEATGTELFYYFVESERSPSTDPVLLWLTGGPRCSALSGLAYEIGSFRYKCRLSSNLQIIFVS